MATIPNHAKQQYLRGQIDWENDTIQVALVSDETSYSLDVDDDEYVSDVFSSADEFGDNGGSGYSRQTVANATTSQDDGDDEGVADGDDVTFSELDGETIQGVLVFKEETDDDDSPVLYYLDDEDVDDLPKDTNGGDITVQWADDGIVNLQ